jgi:hypothetical protein
MLYALLDGKDKIDVLHLQAALELWAYAERSTAHIFGDATGDPCADTILRALRASDSLTRTEINNLFGGHAPAQRINQALGLLLNLGKARCRHEMSGGRPVEIWEAIR